jgi:hypothetical protein
MALVDYDRVLASRERGYWAYLLQMQPPSCSPKNHILCGHFPGAARGVLEASTSTHVCAATLHRAVTC